MGIVPACAAKGALRGGAACRFDSQCAANACATPGPGITCGTCKAPTTDGGCSDGVACPLGSTCNAGTCAPIKPVKLLPAGSACDETGEAGRCVDSAPCTSPTANAAVGTCQAAVSGGACRYFLGSTAGRCTDGSRCIVSGTTKTCTAAPTLGQACAGPSALHCASGLYCSAEAKDAGSCFSQHALGQPCDDNDQCASTAFCSHFAMGPATCMARSKPGERCGIIANTAGILSTVTCEDESACSQPVLSDGGVGVGVCVSNPRQLGEPCDPPHTTCTSGTVCNARKVCALATCTL